MSPPSLIQRGMHDSAISPRSKMSKRNKTTMTVSGLHRDPPGEDDDPSESSTIASHLEVASVGHSIRSPRRLLEDPSSPNSDDKNDGQFYADHAVQRKLVSAPISPVQEARPLHMHKESLSSSNGPVIGSNRKLRDKLVKTSSLRLPQRIDSFHTFDAACDVQPSNPRQRQRRNSAHGSEPVVLTSKTPRQSTRARRASMGEVRGRLQSTQEEGHASYPGRIPESPMSHERNGILSSSPSSPRWNGTITSNDISRGRERRHSLSSGRDHGREIDISAHTAPSKSVDQPPKHPRQRRNSINGPLDTKSPKISPRPPSARSPKRASPRSSRAAPGSVVGALPQQKGLPSAPDLHQNESIEGPVTTKTKNLERSNRSPRTGRVAGKTTLKHSRQQRRNSTGGAVSIVAQTKGPCANPKPLTNAVPYVIDDSSEPSNASQPVTLFQRGFNFLRSRKTTPPSTPAKKPSSSNAQTSGRPHPVPFTPPKRRFFFRRGLSCNHLSQSPKQDSPPAVSRSTVPSTPPVARPIRKRRPSPSNSGEPLSSGPLRVELSPRDATEDEPSRSSMAAPRSAQSPIHLRNNALIGKSSPQQSTKSKIESAQYSPNATLRSRKTRSQRRASCGTYTPPSPGSSCMLDYSAHNDPSMPKKLPGATDQAPTYPSRRRNSINGPLTISVEAPPPIVHDHLPTHIAEESTEASTSPKKRDKDVSPSASDPSEKNLTSLSPYLVAPAAAPATTAAAPPPRTLRGFRGNSCNSLVDSVNEVIRPLETSSRFAAGSFDVGPSHPRQQRLSRRASLDGQPPTLTTPRTPMTPMTPASTMASTISSRSRSRPGLYRRASCGSLPIKSLSPHVDLVSPLTFFEEKLAVQDPGRFASGCGDKAPPAPPQRPPRSKESLLESPTLSSLTTSPATASAFAAPRPRRSRRASCGAIGKSTSMNHTGNHESPEGTPSAVEAAAAMQEPGQHSKPPPQRGLSRRASCGAFGYSAGRTAEAPARILPQGTSSSALRLAQAGSSGVSDLEAMRFSTAEGASTAAPAAKPSAPPRRELPRATSSSALRLAQQVVPSPPARDGPPRQPRRASMGSSPSDMALKASSPRPNRTGRNRRASCSACTRDAYISTDKLSPTSAADPSYWTPTKTKNPESLLFSDTTVDTLPNLPFISPGN